MIYLLTFVIFITALYSAIGFNKILDRYKMYLTKEYWTDYNIIEAAAWISKAAIIIPGLIFGIEVWQLHFLTLATSSALIWAMMRKILPTLILFNNICIFISLNIIIRNLNM